MGRVSALNLPLNDKTREEYEKLLMADSYAKANQMLRTNFDKIYEECRLAELQNHRNILIQALEKKFAKVPKMLQSKIQKLSLDDVNRLLICYGSLSTIKDLPID